MKIIVYERVSTDKQDLARQAIQRERAEADHPDGEIRVIQDDGVSAYKIPIFERDGGRELCSLIEAGEVEAVYADAQDRLSRGDVVEWLTFVSLCQRAGTRIILDGREVRDDDAGVILGVVDALRARGESRDKSHRVRGGLREFVKSGRYHGPRRPYGYTFEGERKERRLILHPGEARTILRMADLYEQGAGDREVAARLNEGGIVSPSGIAWEKSTVANILRSPIIAALVHLNGETFPGLHEAILEPERWQRLQEIREARRGKGRRPNGDHAFTGGILRCPECRAALRPRTTPKGHAYYECTTGSGCPQSSIDARVVEGLILEGLLDLVFDPDETRSRIEAAAGEEWERADSLIAAADRQHREIERKRERAQGDYLDGRLNAGLYEAAVARLDKEAAQAQAHAAELREAAQAAQAEASNLDAEREIVARLQRLQEIIAGDRGPDSVEILRQAIGGTFERVYLAEGEKPGTLTVIPQLRREAVAALRDRTVVAAGFEHGRAQEPKRIPLPASLTEGTEPSRSPLCPEDQTEGTAET